MIRYISLNNFKSFKCVETSLANFSILVGPNNSGKSNFKRALLFLRSLATGNTVAESLKMSCDTIFNVIYQGEEAKSNSMDFSLIIEFNEPIKKIYHYSINIVEENGDFFIKSENLFLSDSLEGEKQPILKNDQGKTTFKEFDKTDWSNAEFEKHKIAISQLNDVNLHKYFLELRRFFSLMWFFDFDPEAMKEKTTYEPGRATLYHPYGLNIAGTLYEIKQKYPESFKSIKERFSAIISEINDIDVIKRDEDNSLLLLFIEKGKETPFIPSNVSDGVLRTLGIITAILSPTPPTLMFLEEVDKGIHFRRVRDIVSLLQSKMGSIDKKQMQVILSTHNPYLLDLIKPEQLLILERHKGETSMKRLSEMQNKMAIIKSFLDEGTPLGEIWFRGSLGGVPPA